MNIVQMHERVRFWIDTVASTRFETEDIDNGLNIAIDNKVRESYDNYRPMNNSDTFQRVQRLRDELGPLVKKLTSGAGLTIVRVASKNSIEVSSAVEDYGWMLSLMVTDSSGAEHPVYPLSYNRKNVISKSSFRRPRTVPSVKAYYIEEEGKLNIKDTIGVLSDAELYYLATPAIVNYGIEYGPAKEFVAGNILYAVTQVVYNGVTYKIGGKITVVAPALNITSGTVVYNYVDCDVRATTHEEITRRAAINCLLTAGQGEKAEALRKEIVTI
jgi:hypothetical protein